MNISWFGQRYFLLQGKKSAVALDPFSKALGIRPPRAKADVAALTINDDTLDSSVIRSLDPEKKELFLIDGPGEYEVKGVYIQGISLQKDLSKKDKGLGDKLCLLVEMEGIRIVHVGPLSGELPGDVLETIDGVDILLLPIGGGVVLNAEQAAKVMISVEPRLVIPMQYKIKGIKDKLEGPEKFAKEVGFSLSEAEDKLKIKKADLPAENTEVVFLRPRQ